MKSFIVEAVSNASMDVYPNNTLSSFTNFLPEPIQLENQDEGDWEVALMEIAYPTWYLNVTEGKFRYKPEKDAPLLEMTIKEGLYNNIDALLDEFKETMIATTVKKNLKTEQVMDSIKIGIDSFSKKVLFNFGYESASLNLASQDLANILGFPTPCVIPGTMKESLLPFDIQRIHTVMVYTNLIEYGIIGDTRAPILRSFPLMPRFKDGSLVINQFMNYQSFNNLQFKKVLGSTFHSIKIDMRSTTGEKIPFAGIGNTRLTLLFRYVAS